MKKYHFIAIGIYLTAIALGLCYCCYLAMDPVGSFEHGIMVTESVIWKQVCNFLGVISS